MTINPRPPHGPAPGWLHCAGCGIELVEKGLKASPRLRIILMSGFVGELNRAEQQLKGKVACVIAKPFTLDDMRNTVKGVLG